jgi:hypothetical protein
MVVERASQMGGPTPDDGWRPLRVAFFLLALVGAFLPTIARSDNHSLAKRPNQGSSSDRRAVAPAPLSQSQGFDPAAASFFSLWSYGAMQVIAPNIYGDFESPTALSFTSGRSFLGPMSQNIGLDPSVSTMLDGTIQQQLLPGGGPAEVEEFGVGSSDITGNGGFQSTDGPRAPSGYSVTSDPAAAPPAVKTAGGIPTACVADQNAGQLQAGGKFWSQQRESALPVQFPRAVYSGIEVRNPLGDLPSGNPSNIPSPGPAGGWCRPLPTPFYGTSPLENRLLWIGFSLLVGGLLVFYLSRGVRRPA